MATLEDGLYAAEKSLADPATGAKLVCRGKTGEIDMKAYERTVGTLMNGKSDPVTKKPAGATTDKVWQAAQK